MILNGITVPVTAFESNVVVPSAELEPRLTFAPAVTVAVSNPVLAVDNWFP